MKWVGVDVGGTFTDAVVYDDDIQEYSYAKSPSHPSDPTGGVLDVMEKLSIKFSEIGRLVHGVTIGTNAVLEGTGATAWLLTTDGFRDVLEIARTNRPVLYDIKSLKLKPLVPRTRTFEIKERMAHNGNVLQPIVLKDVESALQCIPSDDNVALAICFLHSYSNPSHEIAAKKLSESLRPDLFICASHEVLTQYREYERFSTTALNATLGPIMSRYLGLLESSFEAQGYHRDIYIMTSNGGVSTVKRAKELPISTVLSGPAGGVAAAVYLAKKNGIQNLITCDMGGTSTDVCLVEDLRVPITNEQKIAGHANRTPQIEINAVGAGGGSIAWLDTGEILNVGPRSAGAHPGPACYGRGGSEPTVTDANLILNRLHQLNPLAGQINLNHELAMNSIRSLCHRMEGVDELALAEGIIRIAVVRMVSAIKEISMANGHDPRDFVLVAYGGAGPMHAVEIAEELEMQKVLVPVGPGNLAAFGALISDLKRDHVQTRNFQLKETDWENLDNTFRKIENGAILELQREGIDAENVTMQRSVGMRYVGQSWELNVDLVDDTASIPAVEKLFEDTHLRRFGYKTEGATEIVNFRVSATGSGKKPDLPFWKADGDSDRAKLETRKIYYGGRFVNASVYERRFLACGTRIEGPTVIQENGSTTILPDGWWATVLDDGGLFLNANG